MIGQNMGKGCFSWTDSLSGRSQFAFGTFGFDYYSLTQEMRRRFPLPEVTL